MRVQESSKPELEAAEKVAQVASQLPPGHPHLVPDSPVPGAPQARGPRLRVEGSNHVSRLPGFHHLLCRALAGIRRASVGTLSVWGPVLAKGLAVGCALFCMAWLGDRHRDDDVYGQLAKSPPTKDEAMPSAEAGAATPGEQSKLAGTSLASADDEADEQSEVVPPPCRAPTPARKKGITSDGRVILNEANVEELTTLKGVGEKRAQAIAALRTRLGRFRKVSDLLRIRGIGWKSLKKLEPQVVLDRPTEDDDVVEEAAPSDDDSKPSSRSKQQDSPQSKIQRQVL